ncbi:Acyl carrier protein-like [Macleaya cordata]|uniref:Acyl carrier protein-like n=1 Tax=Macleaya cordata TaxID=56857 RepID=A0A200PMX5_MACCD|nr:Acyl carrier protein-like [Macleaya cordata]
MLMSFEQVKLETVDQVCEILRKQLALLAGSTVTGESKFATLGANSLDTGIYHNYAYRRIYIKFVILVFFHDPNGYMIEICNCDNLPVLPLPVLPLSSSALIKEVPTLMSASCKRAAAILGYGIMMESLSMEMINMSF